MATFVYASSQGQHTHSARTNFQVSMLYKLRNLENKKFVRPFCFSIFPMAVLGAEFLLMIFIFCPSVCPPVCPSVCLFVCPKFVSKICGRMLPKDPTQLNIFLKNEHIVARSYGLNRIKYMIFHSSFSTQRMCMGEVECTQFSP